MTLIRDPLGNRLARIEYDKDGYPTGRLFLSDLRLDQVRLTCVPTYYRYKDDLYYRVTVMTAILPVAASEADRPSQPIQLRA